MSISDTRAFLVHLARACYSENEIAEAVGVTRQNVENIMQKNRQNDKFAQSANHETDRHTKMHETAVFRP